MKTRTVSLAFSAGLALAAALGCTARADDSAQETSQGTSDQQAAAPAEQARIGQTTWQLERAFSDQFVRGQIDRDALEPMIDDVIQATPEAARPKVAAHIEQVLAIGEKLASQMSPDERARVATPPAADTSATAAAPLQLITSWGWPGYAGWGGIGAFGFPAYGGCIPYSAGYAQPYFAPTWGGFASGYSSGSYSSYSCGTGYGAGYGFGGLGVGGWYF